VFTLLTLDHGRLPPTINYQIPDPAHWDGPGTNGGLADHHSSLRDMASTAARFCRQLYGVAAIGGNPVLRQPGGSAICRLIQVAYAGERP
jgi:hypothetical protein